jgi:hypothetical protein
MNALVKLAENRKTASRYRLKLTLNDGSRLTKDAANAVRNCRISGNKIYVGGYAGRGRWTKSYSYQAYLVAILDRLGYKYTTGNDAPRGGVTGDYLKVSQRAVSAIESLR